MAKAKTTRKKRRKTASKKLAFSPKNIGKNAKVIAPIALGIILSNVANKVVPTKDPLDDDSKGVPALVIKGGVTALGAVGMATNNTLASGVGMGMALHGGFGLLNEAKNKITSKTVKGIDGIANNPMVVKALDMLIPNLGSTESMIANNYSDQDLDLEPITFDIPYTDVQETNENPYASMADLGGTNEYGASY